MRKLTKKQVIAGGVAAVVVAGGAGAAFAYWTSMGSGSGSATTGSSSTFTVALANLDLKDLTPGGASDTVHFTVTNPSNGHQKLTSTSAKVTGTSNAGCTATDFSVGSTALDAGYSYGDLATNAQVKGTFTLQMVNDANRNQDACQNVTVNLEVDAN